MSLTLRTFIIDREKIVEVVAKQYTIDAETSILYGQYLAEQVNKMFDPENPDEQLRFEANKRKRQTTLYLTAANFFEVLEALQEMYDLWPTVSFGVVTECKKCGEITASGMTLCTECWQKTFVSAKAALDKVPGLGV